MRQPQPFFRPKKNRWYVQLDGKHVNLGGDKDAAFARYHRLMAERANPKPQVVNPDGTVYVASVLDAFVAWNRSEVAAGAKAQRTLDWYVDYLTSFLRFLASLEGDPSVPPAMTVDTLEPFHVYQWVNSHSGWKTGRRGAMTAVQSAFNWAAKAGLLKCIGGNSPLAALKKPPQGRREDLVTEEQYREVLGVVQDAEFSDLLELSWETGCRPHELFTVQASFVDLPKARWVFPVKLSKGKKVQRVVYLSEHALEITRRLMLKSPSGSLLRSTEGNAWCGSSVKCRFQRICRVLGRRRLKQSGLIPPKIPMLNAGQRKDADVRADHESKVKERRRQVNELARQHGIRLSLYLFRHSFITESLVNGLDAVTVSILAGHRDTAMISRHYSHLTQKDDHMRKAANRARATG